MIKLTIALIAIFNISCQSRSFYYDSVAMEGTIKRGSLIKYEPKKVIEKNDIVVFDYYDKRLNKTFSTVLRVVGVPGDEVLFKNGELLVNGNSFGFPDTYQLSYVVKVKNTFDWNLLNDYSSRLYGGENIRLFFLNYSEYKNIENKKIVDSIVRVKGDSAFIEKQIVWNEAFNYFNGFYYGPLKIPAENVVIDDEIKKLLPISNKFNVGDYLKEKLFFVVGDNLHWCYDSRDIGLIPESLIKGVIYKVN